VTRKAARRKNPLAKAKGFALEPCFSRCQQPESPLPFSFLTILLLDLSVADLHGTEVLRQVQDRGASGYVLKDSAVAELIEAIRAVANGDRYLSEKIRAEAMSAVGSSSFSHLILFFDTTCQFLRQNGEKRDKVKSAFHPMFTSAVSIAL
jgi:hypothetical protein